MITKLWKAFKTWHNKPPAPIESLITAKVKRILWNEPEVALGRQNHKELLKKLTEPAKKPKPSIKIVKRHGKLVYQVADFDYTRVYDEEYRNAVTQAAMFCHKLNKKEGRV